MTDIILIKYNAPPFEKETIRSVVKNTTVNYHLTVHDNYPKNENLGVLWNRLIDKSEADNICLLNSDVAVSYGWLGKLEQVLIDYKDAGAVGPVTNNAGTNGQELPKTHDYQVFDYGKRHSMGTLCGFCLLFPKQVWGQASGFPEDFGFYGQECAFLAKVQKMGYRQYVRTDVFVYHAGGASAKLAEVRGEIDTKEALELGRTQRDAYFERLRKNEL